MCPLRIQIEHEFEKSQPWVYFPNVDSIRLRGFDIRALFRGRVRDRDYSLIDFKVLKTLTMESCKPMTTAFGFLGRKGLPRLRGFHIRQEGVTRDDFSDLRSFLWGKSPLESLSILLEGCLESTDISLGAILQTHGPTLKRLLIDVKLKEFASSQDSKRVWGSQCVTDICGNCPNFVELGMPLDWNNTSGKSINSTEIAKCVMTSLPKLGTLNVRNMPSVAKLGPSVNKDVEAAALLVVEQAISVGSCCRKHMRQCHEHMRDPPSLNIISVGALTYSDVWDGSIANSCTQRDDYLTRRTYAIKYREHSRGQWAPLLRLVARGSTNEIQDSYDNISILQPYWLNHGGQRTC